MRQTFYSILLLSALAASARGVVVSGGDGMQNITAPADDFGFANVGRIDSRGFYGSCVYLGSGWVLTAYHLVHDSLGGFQFGPVIFRNTDGADVLFTAEAASATRLKNADASFTDLALFRLTEAPAFLPSVMISESTPAAGSSVILAGNGLNRNSSLTYWNVDTATTPDTWTEVANPPPPADRSGYKGITTQAIRWGTNTLESGITNVNTGFGVVKSLGTDFDNLSGEAQGIVGDSGGALFYKNASTWELGGLIHAIGNADGQPVNTAVFTNLTYAADLATYREQIVAIAVPEPGAVMLLVFGAGCLGLKRLRWTR